MFGYLLEWTDTLKLGLASPLPIQFKISKINMAIIMIKPTQNVRNIDSRITINIIVIINTHIKINATALTKSFPISLIPSSMSEYNSLKKFHITLIYITNIYEKPKGFKPFGLISQELKGGVF